MATRYADSLPDAVEMLKNQHLDARDFVVTTLKIPEGHEQHKHALLNVLHVLATNELTLAQYKTK